MKQLIILLLSSIAIGSGWDTIGSTTSSSYDPDSIWWTNGYGDTTQLEMIHFITPVPEDTIKNMYSSIITDSLIVSGTFSTGFGTLGQFYNNCWITTLGAWAKVASGDTTLVYWTGYMSTSLDSLNDNGGGYFFYSTDTLSVTSNSWSYYEWNFTRPFIVPFIDMNISMYCNEISGGLGVKLGAVQADSIQPIMYGIDSTKTWVSKIPNITLYSSGGTIQDSICVIYNTSSITNGITLSTIASNNGLFNNIYLNCLQSIGTTSSIVVSSPIDFLSSISINGSTPYSGSYIVNPGDSLVISNGVLMEIIATP